MQIQHWKEWQLAFKRSSPLAISTTILGIVFGALVIAGGLSVADGITMSGLVYSGSAQFVGLQLMNSSTSLIVVLVTISFLNLRFFLYALALLEDVRHLPFIHRMLLAFGLIDIVFVLAKKRFAESGNDAEKQSYFVACVAIFYASWVIGTFIGLYLGESLAKYSEQYGLEFFSYATFLTLLAPYLRVRKNISVAVIALLIYICVWSVPYNLGILISCVGAALFVQISSIYYQRKRKDA